MFLSFASFSMCLLDSFQSCFLAFLCGDVIINATDNPPTWASFQNRTFFFLNKKVNFSYHFVLTGWLTHAKKFRVTQFSQIFYNNISW